MAIAARALVDRFGPAAVLWASIVIACSLAISTYSVFCHTWDEPEHLAAGLKLLESGEYPYDVQHPPLARLAMAIGPYLAGAHSYGTPGPSGEQEGRDILYRGGHYNRYLTLARAGMLPFLMLLLIATWTWTRHVFGTAEAIVATLFLISIPPVIGHAAVAALDVPMAATTMLAMYLLTRWFEAGTFKHALCFGIAAGAAMGTKLSAIPFLGCVFVVWFLAAVLNRAARADTSRADWSPVSGQAFAQLASAAGIALAVLVSCYGFGFAPLTPRVTLPVPIGIPRLIASITALIAHNAGGHLSFFMGELRRTGWWNFYLVALGVKTPLPTLLLGLSGLVMSLRRAWRERQWLLAAPGLAFIAILMFASAYSHINIGARHVMVLFPLLAMGASAAVVACWHRFAHTGTKAIARTAIVLLASWQIVGIARAHPDDLAYFNELAGAHPERILVDSDLDWGQDVRRLEDELQARHIADFSLIYRGSADLPHERLPHYRRLGPNENATGWIAVSLLAKETEETGGYRWLDAYRPVKRIGKSIDLYYIK